MNEDEVNVCITEGYISNFYISMVVNDTVMNLSKVELILYAALINLNNQLKKDEYGYFDASTERLVNKVNYGHEFSIKTDICSKSIIRSLKTLKDNGLIDVYSNARKDPITLDYIGKIRKIKINDIEGVKINGIKIGVFNKILSTNSIKLYLLLKSFLKDYASCYVSNKLIAEKLKVDSRKITIYLDELNRQLLSYVNPVLSDGTRFIQLHK